ncbi:MAG: hypothetical protein L3J45_01370 [Flavobacteriaceae bacterium]|nr:hypothetical protein [Flavobacteriaceae bacterium]
MYPKSTQSYLKNRIQANNKAIHRFKIAILVLFLALLGVFIATLFETALIEHFLNSNTGNSIQFIVFYTALYVLAFGFCIYKIRVLEKQNKHIIIRLLDI